MDLLSMVIVVVDVVGWGGGKWRLRSSRGRGSSRSLVEGMK